jgi:hypothetical protein
MSENPEPPEKPNTIGLLGEMSRLKHHRVDGTGLDPRLAKLRAWQARRLAHSYADLLAHERYAPACQFFLDDLYAARDFSQRDHDMLHMHALLKRYVPGPLLAPLTLTVNVHALTERLDQAMCAMLFDEMGVTGELTSALYAQAYRRCDNDAARLEQLDRIYRVGQLLEGVVKQPLTGATLALLAVPARRAGWEDLTGFLERGFKAYKHLRGARPFLEVVRRRETEYLDRIYSGDEDPYEMAGTTAAEA